ncbi:hydrogen gas-evolving membrane-bound hydrogenase subunit E [Poriferisphaera sp. WC338]|uniref:hydrogen gas-evolving membrane-bound hydrogenase subunit E n=1 Tax=Poriferisphaera sp. WC338 TaxID=3425129 RepID=UPI003D817BC1
MSMAISLASLSVPDPHTAQAAVDSATSGSSWRTWMLLIAVFAPLVTGLITLFYPRKWTTLRVLTALAGMGIAFGLILYHVHLNGLQSIDGASGPVASLPWMDNLHLNLAFLTDGLGVFFALLVSGVGMLIVLYARGYFGPAQNDLYRFYPTLGFFATAMIGVVLADYMLLTLLFWELTSISSFLLIGWDRYDKHAVKLGMQAFVTTGMGGMGLFGGILLFGSFTDVWTWTQFVNFAEWWQPEYASFAINNVVLWAFLLMFFGAATKSAQFPWQYWLPGAMAAPTPVSAFLHSATMVKAGVFLTGRLLPVFGSMVVIEHGHEVVKTGLDIWPWLVIILGAFTMVLGALLSINQHDLKRMFAYTTVSQLGLLMTMYGLGGIVVDIDGHIFRNIDFDITQIANHAFYKAPLFMIAGALGHVLSRDITKLGGAIKKHPAMCITIILAGYGLAAGPGTISFQAKELFLYAIYHMEPIVGKWWMVLMAAAIITATCNVAIFLRLTTTLLGLPGGMKDKSPEVHHDDHHHDHEHGFWPIMMWLPALVLVSFQYIGGFSPSTWLSFFGDLEYYNMNYFGVHYADQGAIPTFWYAFSHPGVPLYCSLIAIGCGILLAFSPIFRGVVTDICDRIYPAIYWLAVTGGGKAFRVVQTGNMRHYTVFVLLAFLVSFFSVVFCDSDMYEPVMRLWPTITEYMPGVFLGAIICASSLTLPLVSHRIIRILMLGSCGFTVVAMYLVYQAPDLALTQLMFEIISVVLFVLVLRLLPRDEAMYRPGRLWRAIIGGLTGIAFGWMTLIAAGVELPIRLGEFFPLNTYEAVQENIFNSGRGGGGFNIVNVILVDFRGFDTLGEITVLALAAIGVWSLLPSRRSRKTL